MDPITLEHLELANHHLTQLAEAMLAYIDVTFMVEVRASPTGRMLLIPVQRSVDQALRESGYGEKLDAIYVKYGIKEASK